MPILYSIDAHGVVTFYRAMDGEEREVFATLKARAARANTSRRTARRQAVVNAGPRGNRPQPRKRRQSPQA